MFETDTATASSTDGFQNLGQSARVLMWGFRGLVQCRRGDGLKYAEIQTLFEHFGVEAALAPLDLVLRVFPLMAHTPIALHCAGCMKLSASEASLIAAAAAAQAGDIETARDELERWIIPSAADWAWTPLYEVGRIFDAADLTLTPPAHQRAQVALRVIAGGKTRLH